MPYNQYFYAPKMNKIVVVKSEWVLKNEKLTEKMRLTQILTILLLFVSKVSLSDG